MSLAGGHQISQVLIEVLDIPIHLVADVWVDLGRWSISDVAAIWEDSRVDSGDQLVSLLDDIFLEAVTVSMQELLHIWCVRKPGQAMHVRAASVLQLEPQPVVSSSKDSSVEGLEELHDSMVEEPVGDGWVVEDSLGACCPGVRVVRADESSQFWPLEVCCTVCKEDSGQTQSVNHGEEATPLPLPVLLGATQTGGEVEDSTGEGLSLSPHHVPQLIQGQLAISWVLSDIHSASLQSTMSHLGVEGEESESRVSGKTTIIILHQELEVVAYGDWHLTLAEEVSSSSGKEGGEGTGEIALGGELIEWHSSDGRPHQSWLGGLTLLHRLLHCLLLRHRWSSNWNE